MGTDGYEVKKDFAGPRLVENTVKKPRRARVKKLGPDEWVFLLKAIEEALGIFDARRRIPYDRAFLPS